MVTTDRIIGAVGLLLSLSIFTYYTTWALVTPFVDPHFERFHALFPAHWLAIALPAATLVIGLSGIVALLLVLSSRSR